MSDILEALLTDLYASIEIFNGSDGNTAFDDAAEAMTEGLMTPERLIQNIEGLILRQDGQDIQLNSMFCSTLLFESTKP